MKSADRRFESRSSFYQMVAVFDALRISLQYMSNLGTCVISIDKGPQNEMLVVLLPTNKISDWGCIALASNPAVPGSIIGVPKNFSLDVAVIN